jgi:hypothetical protein
MEICDSNRFYGHAHIIKEYCAYPQSEPIPLAIQHGVGQYRTMLHYEHFEEPLFDYWIYSDYIKRNAIKHLGISASNLHLLGSPFAYLTRHLKYEPRPFEQRSGTIAFPAHSVPGNEVIGKYEEYAEELANLPPEFHPITVSVHPHDIRLGKHKSFIDQGLEVVTCGNVSPLQVNFLKNFIHFCAPKKYITANTLDTACSYAMYLDLKLFFTGSPPPLNTTSEKERLTGQHVDLIEHAKVRERFTRDMVNDPGIFEEQQEMARHDLGHEHLLSPQKLKSFMMDLRSSRKYIEKIKPFFFQLSQQFEKAIEPSGPMQPIRNISQTLPAQSTNLETSTFPEYLSREIEYSKKVTARKPLQSITLVCVSSVHVKECIRALFRSTLHFGFADIQFFTSQTLSKEELDFFPALTVHQIEPINSTEGYSHFILSELPKFVKTDHCLVIQNDGYILNPTHWDEEFLKFDYIGAPWPAALPLVNKQGQPASAMNLAKTRVGNGGFSLRSKKLMDLCSMIDIQSLKLPTQSEDLVICHFYHEWFASQGIQFAPINVAAKFSIECQVPECKRELRQTFGFHGKTHVEGANQLWAKQLAV